MGTTNTLDLNNRINELEKAVSGGDSAQANKADISTEFNSTTNYTAGCFVYYGGKLYQFNADHTAGAWDPTDVVEANVTDQIVSNKSAIDDLTASDVGYDNTDSGLTATTVQGAVDELRQADNIMMSDGVTSVEDAVEGLTSGLTNVIAKSMFGGYSTYYRTTQASIDGIVDNDITAPQTDDTGYFSAENRGTIVGYGIRQFVFGWVNTTKLFAWIVICSYDGIYVGRRSNASTFTITKISD